MQLVFCTRVCTEQHIHFTTPDDVMTLILFKFLYCSFYDKKKEKKNTVNVLNISKNCFLFLQNALISIKLHTKNICCRSNS